MSTIPTLAPFRIRAFRFQWPADLATSLAFEMEALILGWYVLVETGSVSLLTTFASLAFIGTLIAPLFGVAGDRIGHNRLLAAMRGFYASLATIIMTLAFLDLLRPVHVFVIAVLFGLIRPSDIGTRYALVGNNMPPALLMGGMSLTRVSLDAARIFGALAGGGLAVLLGMAPAYAVITTLYLASVLLTLGSAEKNAQAGRTVRFGPRASPWRDFKDGLAYVWRTPHLLATMGLAFLVNLTAFPFMSGVLPYVAKDIYGSDQTGLAWLVAGAGTGAILGSLMLSGRGGTVRPARAMLVFSAAWYGMLLVFAHTGSALAGGVMLLCAGFAQSLCMVPMQTLLMRTCDEQFRGRVMGIRILAVYGLLLGLVLVGPMIARVGFEATATIACLIGLVFTGVIALRWRADLWRVSAPANAM